MQFQIRIFFEIFRQTHIAIISAESLTPRIIYHGESQLAYINYSSGVASLLKVYNTELTFLLHNICLADYGKTLYILNRTES